MLIIDAHLDHAWNALQWNRNLLDPVYLIRVHERDDPGKGRAQNTVALPEMRQGRIALCFATVLARSTGHPVPHIDYRSTAQCYAIGQGQLAYYSALERDGHIRIISQLTELNQHIAGWETWEAAGQTDTPWPDQRFKALGHHLDVVRHRCDMDRLVECLVVQILAEYEVLSQ